MDEALTVVVAAVDELAARSVLPAADAVLEARLAVVHRAEQQLAAVKIALVRELAAAGAAVRAGDSSTAAWLMRTLRLSPTAARRLVLLAAAVDRAPAVVRDALVAGLVGVDQIQAIVAALEHLPASAEPPIVEKAAEALVGHARELPSHQLSRLGQRILWHVAPEVAEEADRRALTREEGRAARDRFLSLTADGPSTVRLRGRLGVEAAAAVRSALDPLCGPRSGSGGVPSAGSGGVLSAGSGGAPPGDDRTPGQRRADALVEICRLALAAGELPDHGGDRPQVVLTVSYDPLARELGAGTLDTGDRVGPETVRRLACDARILPAVLDGSGLPLDLGRERRLFSGPLRRALVLRDGGCAFPGCDRPPRWCDGHHVRHWVDGGPTALANAVLLCGFHHRLVHDRTAGWTVFVDRDGRPAFVPPARIDPQRVPRRNPFRLRQ